MHDLRTSLTTFYGQVIDFYPAKNVGFCSHVLPSQNITMKKKLASFSQMKGRIFLLLVSLALTTGLFGQVVSVNGKVTNMQGESLPGVNVQIRGTQTGTTTDSEGLFSLSVPGKGTTPCISGHPLQQMLY